MSAIRGKNTRPELVIRKALHALGFRYRLHSADLPGKPDLLFPRYRAVIFVNGCFWHGHDCHLFKWPSTRPEFWRNKINKNRRRDCEVRRALGAAGYRVLTVWECALKGRSSLPFESVVGDISDWLVSQGAHMEIRGELASDIPL
jgi:DNA mismatch endonuclease (patch repair protein)